MALPVQALSRPKIMMFKTLKRIILRRYFTKLKNI